ncbi:hypothetical protein AGABI1DRAFT_74994 [Agaricus bisporus var. burnettii JB137-S8]|uniref:Chromosome transmission fidelity protein 8 n=1 Tax=Agaricus bisporus var. burnettii (strain JB137-S8 / ATCC MYA-4627 / FGSC 10392) TaxID=597362 RepID=K5XU98_AGABU|nr:uncharacterized protein AGABI1DRAFT_74994 [Agaricus bisporus var. burnettii JB137-S8]EKM78635.1 hypothetical protein AGABI1DRAFT_74994 [Agaricus bisporus var. burnettii JB137-S8]
MLIPITFNPTSSHQTPKLPPILAKISNDEVVLIELQGKLEVPQSSNKNGQLVGELKLDETDSRKATLMIGHNLLEGTIVQLSKPLAILHRSGAEIDSSGVSSKDGDEEEEEKHVTSNQISWESIGIVKRKVVFAKRPMLIVGPSS